VRLVGFIIAVSIALAAFKAAALVLCMLYPLALLWAVTVRPQEAFGFMLFLIACFLLNYHAVATLAAVVALVAIGVIVKCRGEIKRTEFFPWDR
jgi:hypothetical protein